MPWRGLFLNTLYFITQKKPKILSLSFLILQNFQDIELTSESLKGEKEIALKFVKFQDVQNVQFFVKDNQVCIHEV